MSVPDKILAGAEQSAAAKLDGPTIPPRQTARHAAVVMLLLVLGNLLIWVWTLFAFRSFAPLLMTAGLAYTFGLRHALDADHISAIDNVTRNLMQQNKRPLLVGFFFSLGHSTIVILLSIMLAIASAQIQTRFPTLKYVGGLIGTSVSAFFLFAIAAANVVILAGIVRTFLRMRRGESYDQQSIDSVVVQAGLLGRLFRPIIRLVDRSWKMYFVGFLFGLGFDTATEIGVLGISAAAGSRGLPVWIILLFPLLFTAGMCLIDTADGILMLGAYGWAYVHPIRKIYYNMIITLVSVVIAIVVGSIEVLGLISDQFDLHGRFWQQIDSIDLGVVGAIIVTIFALSWALSALVYRFLRFVSEPAPETQS